ncbi:hypothetical protein [Thermococcus sp.]
MKLRVRFSLIPFALILILFILDRRLIFLMPLAFLAFFSYFIGSIFLILTAFFLIYHKIGDIYGLGIMILALFFVESAYLDREKAPMEHYVILLLAVLLALPTFVLMESISHLVPGFEATALAALILLSLYAFSKLVTD